MKSKLPFLQNRYRLLVLILVAGKVLVHWLSRLEEEIRRITAGRL